MKRLQAESGVHAAQKELELGVIQSGMAGGEAPMASGKPLA